MPEDLLARRPENAYFWGFVAASGEVGSHSVQVVTGDEEAAELLADVAGGGEIRGREVEREYSHDCSVTLQEDEYTVQVFADDVAADAAAALGLPTDDGPGGYRFDSFSSHRRQLLRGVLEGCGTVCSRDDGSVGVSFVHEDERLLDTVRRQLDAEGFETNDVEEASDDRNWFGVGDDDCVELVEWIYRGSEDSGLYSPRRRRKARGGVERARDEGVA